MTVESRTAGPGIALAMQATLTRLLGLGTPSDDVGDLLQRCDGRVASLTTKSIGEAAVAGNALARQEYAAAMQTLGWGIAQVITIVAPEVVIVGGGVSLVGEKIFFVPLHNAIHKYLFPPLRESYRLLPAALGESVVVHGALALARLSGEASASCPAE